MFKKLIFDSNYVFLEWNCPLSNNQSGFKPDDQCTSNLLIITQWCTWLRVKGRWEIFEKGHRHKMIKFLIKVYFHVYFHVSMALWIIRAFSFFLNSVSNTHNIYSPFILLMWDLSTIYIHMYVLYVYKYCISIYKVPGWSPAATYVQR